MAVLVGLTGGDGWDGCLIYRIWVLHRNQSPSLDPNTHPWTPEMSPGRSDAQGSRSGKEEKSCLATVFGRLSGRHGNIGTL